MIDGLFLKKYDENNYNCCHFVIDAYKIIEGIDLSNILNWRNITLQHRHLFKVESDIKNKTLLSFMSNVRENHIGLLYKNKILHLRKTRVEYQPIDIATRFFTKVRYYSCNV